MNLAQLSTINYIDNGQQFLLLKRDKKENDINEGKYISVGGKFEPGETPEECARREIYEESGLVAGDLDLRGMIVFPDFRHDGIDWVSYVYRVKDYTGQVKNDCDEGTLVWVDYDQLMDMPTWEGDYIFLEWILEEKDFFSARFIYNKDGNLADWSVEFYPTNK